MRSAAITYADVPSILSLAGLVRTGVAIALAVAIAFAVDRLALRAEKRIAGAVSRGQLSPEVRTRVRFARRLIYAIVIVTGVTIALAPFAGAQQLASSLLASGAITAAVLGFAARQTLGNVVAGLMIAITQPIRVGDWVTFENNYGIVEDVSLNYTRLRTGTDQRVMIPNERLATSIIINDTVVNNCVNMSTSLWLGLTTDFERVLAALTDETGQIPEIAETTAEGVRIAVSGGPIEPDKRSAEESLLLTRCLNRLYRDGLLASASSAKTSRNNLQ